MKRRFVYRDDGKGGVEIFEVPVGRGPPRIELMLDSHYDGLRATDGTDISSRRRHREYMRLNGLTTADDFKSSWERSFQERMNIRQGHFDTKQRRETILRALHQHERR